MEQVEGGEGKNPENVDKSNVKVISERGKDGDVKRCD